METAHVAITQRVMSTNMWQTAGLHTISGFGPRDEALADFRIGEHKAVRVVSRDPTEVPCDFVSLRSSDQVPFGNPASEFEIQR